MKFNKRIRRMSDGWTLCREEYHLSNRAYFIAKGYDWEMPKYNAKEVLRFYEFRGKYRAFF